MPVIPYSKVEKTVMNFRLESNWKAMDYEAFTDSQYKTLTRVTNKLLERYPKINRSHSRPTTLLQVAKLTLGHTLSGRDIWMD